MKNSVKQLFIIMCIVSMTIVGLGSCGVVNKRDKVERKIKESLSNFDFEKAHQLLKTYPNKDKGNIFEEDHEYIDRYDNILRTVYEEEITYLVEQNTDASWEKAFFLIKEAKSKYDEGTWPLEKKLNIKLVLSAFLADYAVTFDHHETAIRIDHYIDEILEKLILEKNDLEKKRGWVLPGDRERVVDKVNQAIMIKKKCSRLFTVEDIVQNKVDLDIENEEMIAKLAALNDKDISDKILYVLVEKEIGIPAKPEIGMHSYSFSVFGDESPDISHYNSSVEYYNNLCKMILLQAINNKNKYLAENVITHVKPVIAILDRQYKGDEEKVYLKTNEDNSFLKEIRTSYNNAIKKGAFK